MVVRESVAVGCCYGGGIGAGGLLLFGLAESGYFSTAPCLAVLRLLSTAPLDALRGLVWGAGQVDSDLGQFLEVGLRRACRRGEGGLGGRVEDAR